MQEKNEASGNGLRRLTTRWLLAIMEVVGRLPLSWVRALGALMGLALHLLAPRRRRIAQTNWRLCFPDQTPAQCRAAVRRHFILFSQAWLDRGWYWYAPEKVVRRRFRVCGQTQYLQGGEPLILFAPHFVGLDAGWTALTLHSPRSYSAIYTEQVNPQVDAWMMVGRTRFGRTRPLRRHEGLRSVVNAIKAGEVFHLSPDMDHGMRDSVWAPFFGVPAATVTSLSRFARLSGARVAPVITRLTPQGYDVEVLPAWDGFPSGDVQADTERMNRHLQDLIRTMPEQYYWVHKRFKSRPPGEPGLYGRD